jgi:hypothetical protein
MNHDLPVYWFLCFKEYSTRQVIAMGSEDQLMDRIKGTENRRKGQSAGRRPLVVELTPSFASADWRDYLLSAFSPVFSRWSRKTALRLSFIFDPSIPMTFTRS